VVIDQKGRLFAMFSLFLGVLKQKGLFWDNFGYFGFHHKSINILAFRGSITNITLVRENFAKSQLSRLMDNLVQKEHLARGYMYNNTKYSGFVPQNTNFLE
jgi:hypothetical protein